MAVLHSHLSTNDLITGHSYSYLWATDFQFFTHIFGETSQHGGGLAAVAHETAARQRIPLLPNLDGELVFGGHHSPLDVSDA